MSKEVKRYDHAGDYCGPQCGFEESADGDWVHASDYDALLAELGMVARELTESRVDLGYYVARNEQLRTEVESLRKDAERYRWLAEHQAEEFPDFIVIHEYITDPDAQGCFTTDTYRSKSQLDVAIDGAMQQS